MSLKLTGMIITQPCDPSHVAQVLHQNPSITKLDLRVGGDVISVIDPKVLPEGLEDLKLVDVGLTSVPDLSTLRALKRLDLRANPDIELGDESPFPAQLEYLYMDMLERPKLHLVPIMCQYNMA